MLVSAKKAMERFDTQTIISLALLIIPSVVAWALFFPGLFQADHQAAVVWFANGRPSPQHSLLWTVLAFPFLYYTPSYGCYGLVQIACFVAASFFSAHKLKKLGIIKSLIPLSALLGLFPTFLLYNNLYCSDICFAYVVLCLTVSMVELLETKGEVLRSRSFCARTIVLVVLAICLRKNALIMAITLCVAVPIFFAKRRWVALCVFGASLVLGLLIDSVLLPLALHATPSQSQELLSVPTTQIARVFSEDGTIPDDVTFITQDRSPEEWADSYLPDIADKAKWGQSLSWPFIHDWLVLGINNPKAYIRAYLTLEHPFWTFGYAGDTWSTIDFRSWSEFTLDNADNNVRPEYLAQFAKLQAEGEKPIWLFVRDFAEWCNDAHIPVLTEIVNFVLYNRGLAFWTLVVGFVVSARGKKKYFFMASVPVFSLLVGFLLFAPVAQMRYAMEMYYAIPVLIIYLVRRTVASPLKDCLPLRARGRSEDVHADAQA